MLGSARQRFLDAAAPRDDDEPVGLAGALQLVLDLLKDPKKAADLAKRALEAQRIIDQAAKVTADLEAAKRKSEDGIAAARAEIERLRADHDAAVTAASRKLPR